MQVYALEFSAVLTNVTNVRFREDGYYRMKIQCTNCFRVPITRYVRFNQTIKFRGEVSGKDVNFIEECQKCCGWQEIVIATDSMDCYRSRDTGYFKTLAEFKFIGCKPVAFFTGPIFSATSVLSSTVYGNVDLSYRGSIHTWCGFDKIAGKGLTIAEVKTRFVPVRVEPLQPIDEDDE